MQPRAEKTEREKLSRVSQQFIEIIYWDRRCRAPTCFSCGWKNARTPTARIAARARSPARNDLIRDIGDRYLGMPGENNHKQVDGAADASSRWA